MACIIYTNFSVAILNSHSTLIDLFKHHICHETSAANDSLCNYYFKMCDESVMPIYVYISPKEMHSSEELFLDRGVNNTLFGVVPKGTETAKELGTV